MIAATATVAPAIAAPALADPPADWRRGDVVVSDAAMTSSVRRDDRAVRTGPPTGATDPGISAVASDSDDGAFDWSSMLAIVLVVGALGGVGLATPRRDGRLPKAPSGA